MHKVPVFRRQFPNDRVPRYPCGVDQDIQSSICSFELRDGVDDGTIFANVARQEWNLRIRRSDHVERDGRAPFLAKRVKDGAANGS